MATKQTDSPIKSSTGSGAESPTTVRPLDMDDDDFQDTSLLSGDVPTSTLAPRTGDTEEIAPPKPPRPLNARQQAENTLKEAFPTIDAAVVKAVLTASGGRVEPAFNALLGMSDPDAVVEQEPLPPPQPPRPITTRAGSTPQSQLEADEMYARQLAEHYDGTVPMGKQHDARRLTEHGRKKEMGLKPNELRDEGHSFLDDDLPIIKENLRQGFVQTQKTVNNWITNLKKRIDGEDIESGPSQGIQGGASGINQSYGTRRSGDTRRSSDYNRYDADPQVLGDDFAGIQLNNDGTPAPRRSTRPLANPDLFKPTTKPSRLPDGRKVAFQNGPPEDIDLYQAKDVTPSSKQSKWQPLSTVDPSPIGETENDPFSLGDSEDERESKDRVGSREIRMEDTERLKQASEIPPVSPIRKPEVAETSGTKDKPAEEKLTEKS